MEQYILSIDQGTTSTRAILFDRKGTIRAMTQQEFTQIFPHPGWVEHDPIEIWASTIDVIGGVIIKRGIRADQIAAIGITNQRETTVVWNKETGEPIYNAIVWQSRQSLEIAEAMIDAGMKEVVHKKTGLIINPYFSATKIAWILEHVPGARDLAKDGKLLFGTIDTWLVWKLTGGKVHVTDYSNASRTMLFNIQTLTWDEDLLEYFKIPRAMLPDVRGSSEIYGFAEQLSPFGATARIPIAGLAGDQQAALFGQCCFEMGSAKNTYGTGCFLLMNTGKEPVYSHSGLLTTIAWGINGTITYALEGSVFVGGSVIQWVRDGMRMLKNASESEQYAMQVASTEGVYFVPAFVGLGTPYWDSEARGAIFGLTRGTTKEHFVRAALESIAFQSKEVMDVMKDEACLESCRLAADGGATENKFLMQFQADLLQCRLQLPYVLETTALGAAYLAGLAVGFFTNLEEIKSLHRIDRLYEPQMDVATVNKLVQGWKKAVACTLQYK